MIEGLQNKLDYIQQYFNKLSFIEDTHSYYFEGNKLSISVSGIVKQFTKFTDFKSISYNIDKRDNLPNGTTLRFWKLKTDVALAKGNKAHYFGEVYALSKNIKPTDGYEEAIVKFFDSLPKHIIPVFTELKMFHKVKMFAGTTDIVLYNTVTEKFIIADYKTNENLFKNFKEEKLKHPFNDLLNHGYNKYQIQFSLYQILFEQSGFEVEKRCLIWLKEDGTFKIYFTEDLTQKLKKYLKDDTY